MFPSDKRVISHWVSDLLFLYISDYALCVFQPAKARKKRRKKDKSVTMQSKVNLIMICNVMLILVSNRVTVSLLDGEPTGSCFRQLSGQHCAVM